MHRKDNSFFIYNIKVFLAISEKNFNLFKRLGKIIKSELKGRFLLEPFLIRYRLLYSHQLLIAPHIIHVLSDTLSFCNEPSEIM